MRTLAIGLLTLWLGGAAAQATTTKVGGTLKANESWTAAGGPYLVTGTITVASGITLTIEAGTSVYLNSSVSLVAANGGRILAEGTETQQIRFTRPPAVTASWGGITISGAVNSPETRLAYVYFEGNGQVCIEVSAGTLYLDHATFGTTTRQYVSLDGGSFLISHCYFPTATGALELLHGTGGIKSGGRGIVRDSFFGGTTGYNDTMDFTGGNRDLNQPIIQYYNNVFMGSSDDILDLDGTDAWIEGNIFLHSHRNGAPDSSSAVSGGNNSGRTSEITIIGNLIFDCDNAATAKQGNFFTLINNTIVHTTKQGGQDFASGIVVVRDTTPSLTALGVGFYLEGNVILDAEQLVRNYDAAQTTVTFNNNILPMPWTGPGSGNIIVDPQLKHVPQVSETQFASWEEAQVMWDWFSLRSGSAGKGTGPNGTDMGGVIPLGVSISGEPAATTNETSATLTVGVNRKGNGIPTAGFPLGSGFTHYKWRLDTGVWSVETPIATPIKLADLAEGSHHVEVIGKNDAGLYQNDPALDADAVVAMSRTWKVDHTYSHLSITEVLATGSDYAGAVELYYEGSSPLDLTGMAMTKDPNSSKWFIMPSQTQIASGQYLVLYADANTVPSGLHLGFTLDGEGDRVYLYDKRGVLVDSVVFGPQLPNLSIGRVGYDGQWHLTVPTLGYANIACPTGNADLVRINEWLTDGGTPSADDFVELYNPQANPVDLEGLCLADSPAALTAGGIGPLSFMQADGYRVFWGDKSDQVGREALHLLAHGGTIDLFDGQSMIDSIAYGSLGVGVSQGRVPDGSDTIQVLPSPTPGSANGPGVAVVTETATLVPESADKRVLVPAGPISDDWRGGKAFDDSTWLLCTGRPGGVGYERDSGYQSLITLDTQALMYGSGKNNTCYIRIPFTVDTGALTGIKSLALNVRYDDGFVAYLNGVEVARGNFTGTPSWNSFADIATEASVTSFDASADITSFKSQLKAGANILAIHGMNASTTSSDFLISVALDAVVATVESRP